MKNISNIIMQETPPKMTNVGWLKPEKNKVVLKFFINGKWTTVDTGGGNGGSIYPPDMNNDFNDDFTN